MKVTETKIHGVFVIELERHEDDRGWFARAWCRDEFAANGLPTDLAQCNLSHNAQCGTVRGMHLQTAPYSEAKLVRCVGGAVHDVALDLRPESPTFKQFYATELTAENGRAVFLPEGIAHGFQTLADNATLFYQMSTPYAPQFASGVRWNDAALQIEWPIAGAIVCERDLALPDFTE